MTLRRPRVVLAAEQAASAAALRAEGWTICRIASRLGVTERLVREALGPLGGRKPHAGATANHRAAAASRRSVRHAP